MFDALPATLNCTGPPAAAGAVHSIVHVLIPRGAAIEPVRLCWMKVSGGTVRNMEIDKAGNL